MSRLATSVTSLPSDLIQEIISTLMGIFDESELDTKPLPLTLIVLQLVSKRFRAAIMKQGSLSHKKVAVSQSLKSVCKEVGSSAIPLLEWVTQKLKYRLDPSCAVGALERGDVTLYNWVRSRTTSVGTAPFSLFSDPLDKWSFDIAAAIVKSEKIEMIRWAKESFSDFSAEDTFRCAIDTGNVRLVEYLYGMLPTPPNWDIRGREMTKHVLCSGSVPLLQFAIDHGATVDHYTLVYASMWSLQIVRFLREERNVAYTPEAAEYAAGFGRVDVLNYYRSQGLPMDLSAVAEIALYRIRLATLRWCIEKGLQFKIPQKPRDREAPVDKVLFLQELNCVEVFYADGATMLRFLEQYDKERLTWILQKDRNSSSIPVQWVRLLTSLGYRSPVSLSTTLNLAVVSGSYYALDAVKFLMEDLKVPLSRPISIFEQAAARSDVKAFLKEKGLC